MANRDQQPGRAKPTWREDARESLGRSEDWRFPEKRFEKGEDKPGLLLCPRCHAISEIKRWYYDEDRYQELKNKQEAQFAVCPGCERIERQIYEGDVVLRGPFLAQHKEEALHLIYHAEDQARQKNPISRLASVEDNGDEVKVITTTRWLAERIGKEFRKAFNGDLEIQRLPREKFSRVRWERAA
ncbi:MAG: BCAM0308 family protein [Chloroflexota bacterium]